MKTIRTFGRLGVSVVGLALAGCAADPQPNPNERIPIKKEVKNTEAERLSTDQEKSILVMNRYFTAVELLEKREVATAMLEFEQCTKLNPKFAPAYFKLSICFYQREQYGDEIKALQQCTEIDPTYLEAWLNLGHAYLAQEKLDDAKRCYLKVIDLDPNHPIAHYNVGLIYFDQSQFDESAKHLRHALDVGEKLKRDLREKAQHYLKRCEARG